MARIDNIKKQHPDFDVSLLDIILSVDPTKSYKYADFLIKMIKQIIKPEEIMKVIAEGVFGEERLKVLNDFEKHSQANRIAVPDISAYNSWDQLTQSVKQADEVVKQKELEKQVTKLHEDGEWLVVIPHSFEASKSYGANTKWCTTQETHWNSYYPNYKLIYIINKVRNEKYAISRKYDDDSKIQAWLSTDKEISPLLVSIPPELMTKIIVEVKKRKNEMDLSRLGGDSIFTENGMIVSIDNASAIMLNSFMKKYNDRIPIDMVSKINNRLSEISELLKKSDPSDDLFQDNRYKDYIGKYLKENEDRDDVYNFDVTNIEQMLNRLYNNGRKTRA